MTILAAAALIVVSAAVVTAWVGLRMLVTRLRARRLRSQAAVLATALGRLRARAYDGIDQVLFDMRDVFDPQVIEVELRRELGDAADRPASLVASFRMLGLTDRYLVEVRTARAWRDRARAATTLGLLGEVRAVRPLVEGMRDPHEDGDVKLACAEALGRLRDRGVIAEMCSLLVDVDEWASPRLAQVLCEFGDAAVEPLLATLDRGASLNARVWAAQILGKIADPRATWPLIERLHDHSEQLRVSVANALAELGDARAVAPLIGVVLRDPVAAVRAQAARALGALRDERALPLLISSLGDPDYWMRFRALEAIEALDPSDTSAIETALADANPEVRRRAVLALERMGKLDKPFHDLASPDEGIAAEAERRLVAVGRAGLAERLIRHLGADDARTRARIARVLGQIGDARHADALVAALTDRDPAVTIEVIAALGALAQPATAGALIERLVVDHRAVRIAAAAALRLFDGAMLAGHLARLAELARDPSDEVRVVALRVVAAIREPAVIGVLLSALGDRFGDARLEAATALGARCATSGTAGESPGRLAFGPMADAIADALAGILDDSSEPVRIAAADALGRLGGAHAIDQLLAALPRAEASQRDAICAHLADLGLAALAPAIDVLLASPDAKARIGLTWTLGKTTDPRAVPLLRALLAEPDAAVRASAAGALAKIASGSATAALAGALADPHPRVRAAAINALGRRGAEATEHVGRGIDDPDHFVRRRAAIALARAGGETAARRLLALPRDTIEPPVLVIALALTGSPLAIGEAVHRLRSPEIARGVEELLADEDPGIRQDYNERMRPKSTQKLPVLRGSLGAIQLIAEQALALRDEIDPIERRRAAIALAQVSDIEATRALAHAVRNDPDVEVRRDAILALAGGDPQPAVREAVMIATRDPDPRVRSDALRAAGGFIAPGDAGPLRDALRALDPTVRAAAEEAVAAAHTTDVEPLHDWMTTQGDPAVVAAAIRALGRIAAPGSLAPLQTQLRAASPIVRAEAVAALAQLANPAALGAVLGALGDPVESVRIAAVRSLAMASRGDVVEALAAVVYDPSVEVRVTVAITLATLTSTRTVELLGALTGDAAPRVAARAALGLLVAPDDEGLAWFLARHPGLSPEVRTLIRQGVDLVAPAVQDRLTGSLDPRIRELAVRVLAAIDPVALGDTVALGLRDPDPAVRIATLEGLVAAGPDKLADRLRAVLDDPVGEVRTAARRALVRPV